MPLFSRPKAHYGMDTPQAGGVGANTARSLFNRPPKPGGPVSPMVGMTLRGPQGSTTIPLISNRGIPLDTGTGWVDSLQSGFREWGEGRQNAARGALGLPPAFPAKMPVINGVPGNHVPPAKMPVYGADGTPIYEPKFYEQMRRNNGNAVLYAPSLIAGAQGPSAGGQGPRLAGTRYAPEYLTNPADAERMARQRVGIAANGQPPEPASPWGQVQQNPANTGIDPARIFRYPELAGVASSMGAYQGMANQYDQMAASGALRDRNMGVYNQMGQSNSGLDAARAQADGILGGASATRPRRLADGSYDTAPVLSPDAAGAIYGNSPLAGAPMVKPRFGQTLQEAQRDYMGTMAGARAATQQRVGEMFDAGGQYQRGPAGASLPGFIGTSVGPSNQRLTVSQGPLGGGGTGPITITGQRSAQEWGAQASNLPGADGRTNAEMAAARRGVLRDRAQEKRDQGLIAYAGRQGQSPLRNAGLFGALKRQGMPIRGASGAQAATPAEGQGPQSVGEAVKQLTALGQDPLFAQLDFDPVAADARRWSQLLQNPDLANLSPTDVRTLQSALRAAQSQGMNLNPGSGVLEEINAFQSGGPQAVQGILEQRKKKRPDRVNQIESILEQNPRYRISF